MSRPFSYNDENFTVIGNLLFCHIRVTKALSKFDDIIEIPPEIYKRLLHKTNNFINSSIATNISMAEFVRVGLEKSSSDNKYYIYVASDISDIGNYLIGYYILKDI